MSNNATRAHGRIWRCLWAAALLSLATLTIASGPASAHAYLESSTPAENAQLSAVPNQVTLTFGDSVEAEFTKVTLSVGSDAPGTLATIIENGVVTVPIPSSVEWQPPGTTAAWMIAYRTVADDGHPVEGTLAFTVTASAMAIPSPTALTPEPSAPNAEGTGRQSDSAEVVEPFPWTAVTLLSAGSVALATVLWLLTRRARRAGRP